MHGHGRAEGIEHPALWRGPVRSAPCAHRMVERLLNEVPQEKAIGEPIVSGSISSCCCVLLNRARISERCEPGGDQRHGLIQQQRSEDVETRGQEPYHCEI